MNIFFPFNVCSAYSVDCGLCVTAGWLCCTHSCVCSGLGQRSNAVCCWYSALCSCVCVSSAADIYLCECSTSLFSCSNVLRYQLYV